MIFRTRKPTAQRPAAPRRTVTSPTGCKTCTAVRSIAARAVALVTRKPK